MHPRVPSRCVPASARAEGMRPCFRLAPACPLSRWPTTACCSSTRLASMGAYHLSSDNDPLGLPQDKIDNPATPDVWPLAATVLNQLHVVATRFLQGISQDGQVFEKTLVIDPLCDAGNGEVVPHQPGLELLLPQSSHLSAVRRTRSKRVAEDVAQEVDQCGVGE